MTIQFNSQNCEDRALSSIFSGKSGTCMEVGAHDGVHLSNTYYFEQVGWRCILVEPNGELCEKIRRNRRATVFECAASDQVGQVVLYAGEGSDDVYSSLESPRVVEHAGPCRRLVVSTRSLDAMLEEAAVDSIDFVTIDVEGHEAAVLNGFTLNRWNPQVVIIEDNSDLTAEEVQRHMRKAGYFRFYRTGANDWYATKNARRIRLLMKIVAAGCFSLKGFVKGTAPRGPMRLILLIKRMLLEAEHKMAGIKAA
jgi:FkbM family methyltransferase